MSDSFEKLIKTRLTLNVWTFEDGTIGVTFDKGWIDDGVSYCGTFGRGMTLDFACSDYLSKLDGKVLVIDPGTTSEKRYIIVA